MEDWRSVNVTGDPLHIEDVVSRVRDPSSGAIATFTGTTRNTFDGKDVIKLEYEAYKPLAIKKLKEVCEEARARWQISRIAVVHRIGTVNIGEPSVIIATSSPHRRAALEACAWAIDELKAVVPIWKKEYFVGGEVWKENAESRLAAKARADAGEAA